jgi:hypothetical protein
MRNGCEESGEQMARRGYSKQLPSVFSKSATSLYRSRASRASPLLCRTHVLLIASSVLPRSARCRKLPPTPTLQRNHSSPAISLHRPRIPFRYALPSRGWREARKGDVPRRSSGSTFPWRLTVTARLLRGNPFAPHSSLPNALILKAVKGKSDIEGS